MTESNFPFEAFSEGVDQANDTSKDVSFINEFNEPLPSETPADQVQDSSVVTDNIANDQGNPVVEAPIVVEPTPVAAATDVAEMITKEDYDKVLNEKQLLADQIESLSKSQLDENGKKLYDYIREGRLSELKEYLDIQTQDFKSKSQEEIVKDFLKAQNPDWSKDDIDDVLSSKYGLGLDEELLTDQEKRKFVRELKTDAQEALKFFESKKAEISLPDLNPTVEAPAGPSSEEVAAQAELWNNSVTESLKSFDKLSINIKENEQFDFGIDTESRTQLIEDLKALGTDITVFFKPYITPEGKVDALKLAQDMAFLKNKETIVRSAVVAQVAKAQDDWLKGIKNTNINPSEIAPVVQDKDDIADFIANKIF